MKQMMMGDKQQPDSNKPQSAWTSLPAPGVFAITMVLFLAVQFIFLYQSNPFPCWGGPDSAPDCPYIRDTIWHRDGYPIFKSFSFPISVLAGLMAVFAYRGYRSRIPFSDFATVAMTFPLVSFPITIWTASCRGLGFIGPILGGISILLDRTRIQKYTGLLAVILNILWILLIDRYASTYWEVFGD